MSKGILNIEKITNKMYSASNKSEIKECYFNNIGEIKQEVKCFDIIDRLNLDVAQFKSMFIQGNLSFDIYNSITKGESNELEFNLLKQKLSQNLKN